MENTWTRDLRTLYLTRHHATWAGHVRLQKWSEAKVIPNITRTSPLIICRTRLTVLLYHAQYWSNTRIFEGLFWMFIHHWSCKCNQFTTTGRSKNSLPINTQIRPVRPQKWSRRKSDPQDLTDWSTDYMLCKTYCVTALRTVLIKYKYLWRMF